MRSEMPFITCEIQIIIIDLRGVRKIHTEKRIIRTHTKRKTMKRLLTFFFLCSLLLPAGAQQLAFPGADGYAKYITGGRGGKVYYVTSLKDCTDDNLVPGTRRWALRTGDDTPRTILFAVNGTIYLESKLKTTHNNVSILGQSAPGGGICITG